MKHDKIKKVFYNELDKGRKFLEYDSCYLFTTENISGYIPNLEGKDVLSVCSSGDHYLNSILMGAEHIDLFDINKLTLMILKLKRIAICRLSLEEFMDFFGIKDKRHILDYNIYKKFKKYLDLDVLEYFDYIYSLGKYSGDFLYNATGLLIRDTSPVSVYKLCDKYLDESNYYYLRKLISRKEYDSQFIHTDVNNLSSKLSRQYDCIFLSNIQDYQDPGNYLKVVKNISGHLKPNGSLYYAYTYNNTVAYNSKVYAKFMRNNPECYSISVPSVYIKSDMEPVKDKVLVLGKFREDI